MKKLLASVAAIAFSGFLAYAATGIAPSAGGGPALIDQTWALGVAGGMNYSYQYALSGAGTTQAGATQIPSGMALVEFDTVASSSGGALPFCYQGTQISLYNNGANPLTVYPNVTNNPITAAQDTINNTTSVSVNAHTAEIFFCAKNGVWAAK